MPTNRIFSAGTIARKPSAQDYLEYADECMEWAKTARSDRERGIFLQMAQTWMQAATLAGGVPVQPSPPIDTAGEESA
jgi:hypothetical protein